MKTDMFICRHCGRGVPLTGPEGKFRPYCSAECKKAERSYKNNMKLGAKALAADNRVVNSDEITFDGRIMAAAQMGISYGQLMARIFFGQVTESQIRQAIADRREAIRTEVRNHQMQMHSGKKKTRIPKADFNGLV